MLLSASSSSFPLSLSLPVDRARLERTMTAMPASRTTRHRETAKRQSSSGVKLSKTRSIVPACLLAVQFAQQLADIDLRFVNQRRPSRLASFAQPFRMALLGSIQNAQIAAPTTSRHAATAEGACHLSP